jgi:hypothetical protein
MLCAGSCDNIISIARQFHHREDTKTLPLIMVYAVVMAAISIIYTNPAKQLASDSSISFLLRVLQDCAQVYKLAEEARTRLMSFIVARSFANDQSQERNIQSGISQDLAPNPFESEFLGDLGNQENLLDGMSTNFNKKKTIPGANNNNPLAATDGLDGYSDMPRLLLPDHQGLFGFDSGHTDGYELDGDFRGWFSIGQ